MSATTAMSESASLHSAKLVSLANSLSVLGLDAANGIPVSPPDSDEPPLLVREHLFYLELTSLSVLTLPDSNQSWH